MKQPLAYVHPEAKIADNVVIEPFVTIDKDVVIEEAHVEEKILEKELKEAGDVEGLENLREHEKDDPQD